MSYNRDIKRKPYRIQGTASYCRGNDFETNKAYETFEDAEHAAEVQACNATNVANRNRFIIYKALAIVGPSRPPCTTIMLDDLD